MYLSKVDLIAQAIVAWLDKAVSDGFTPKLSLPFLKNNRSLFFLFIFLLFYFYFPFIFFLYCNAQVFLISDLRITLGTDHF